MDRLSIQIPRSVKRGVTVVINGHDLLDLVKRAELPHAKREGSPSLAGAYRGLPIEAVLLPSLHLFGEPNTIYSDGDNRPYILMCSCEEPGCWSLSMKVSIEKGLVTWSEFRQEHRQSDHPDGEWSYANLGPFQFSRAQYEQALAPSSERAT